MDCAPGMMCQVSVQMEVVQELQSDWFSKAVGENAVR